MSQDPFASKASRLAELSRAALASGDLKQTSQSDWQLIAEDCVLARIDSIRILGGLPMHLPALSANERLARLKLLLGYWANGYPYVIDECLFADILKRRRPTRHQGHRPSHPQ